MMPVDAARALLQAQVRPLPGESVPLEQALGRVLAADATAAVALPPFDNSAMDGFALQVDDAASLPAGTERTVSAQLAAGDGPATLAPGTACAIMTGARMPARATTVVPVEQVQVLTRDAAGNAASIRLSATVAAAQHVRRAGEDIAAGALAVAAGTRIEPQHAMLLRGAGRHRVQVAQRPRVAIFNTGRELVGDDRPLGAGDIHDTNGPYLHDRLHEAGAEVVLRDCLGDDPAAFAAALQRAVQAGVQAIVSTGAVSMGRHDFIPATLAGLGAEQLFHKLAMRPGKPLLCARLPEGTWCFGLPGNPVSTAVGLRFFVEPALRRMLGMPPERPLMLPLQHAVDTKPGITRFHKGRVCLDAAGRASVQSLPGQESFRIHPLAAANAWLELPATATRLQAGQPVAVWPLSHARPFWSPCP